MSVSRPDPRSYRPVIRTWLLIVAALVFAVAAVGGGTRLTGSGLSIVEWRPVAGVLPPLSDAGWRAEFEKYKTIPQYRELNRGMSLDEFKVIYWWEWTHRLLGRLIGVAFLVPLLFFLWKGWIERGLRARLWTIFVLGAVQGAVGWWMVASGLAERLSVSQYRLAFHLTLACVIFAMILWTAQQLKARDPVEASARARWGATTLVVLVLAQIYLGALVAGRRAGLTYNTWPLIDGAFIPEATRLFFEQPWWRNLFENPLMVQFNHRMVAYVLWVVALIHAVDVVRKVDHPNAVFGALLLASAVTVQAGLGIWTLISSVPLAMALGHQSMAVIVLTIAVVHAEQISRRKPAGRSFAPTTP